MDSNVALDREAVLRLLDVERRREAEALLLDLKKAENQTELSKKIADSRGLLSLSAIAIVGIDLGIFALVVWAVLG